MIIYLFIIMLENLSMNYLILNGDWGLGIGDWKIKFLNNYN